MPKTIYALLVGINKYAPASGVSALYGCVKDVEAMQQFLQENYHQYNPQIELLKNGCATRVNIMNTFHSHLIQQAKAGDTVLFYYSGHGSYAKTAPEFAAFDLQAQDETFVCYDSRLPGHYDLADKEIAVLLSKINPAVHVVVIADSCHADSITRGEGIEATKPEISRHCPSRDNDTSRDLSTYFLSEADNYYLQQKRAGKKISIPASKHTVISACSRNQSAKEKFQRGVFSYHLLDTLQKTGLNISYTQLYQHTNAAVLQDTYQQIPNLSSYDNFDLRKTFLLDGIINSTTPFLVTYDRKAKEWSLDHGAIYGLSTAPQEVQSLQVGIFQQKGLAEDYDLFKIVSIKEVKLKTCYLHFDYDNDHMKFRAAFLNAKPTTFVYLNGTAAQKQTFKEIARQHKSPFIAFTPFKSKAHLELQISDTAYCIIHPKTGSLIHGCTAGAPNSISYIVEKLAQIDKYETLVHLDNTCSKLNRSAIEFRFVAKQADNQSIAYPNKAIRLNQQEKGIDFYLELKNHFTRDLYIAIYHFSPQFEIETVYKCDKLPKAIPNETPVFKKIQNAKSDLYMDIFDAADASVTDYFKLFISTAPFNDYKFTEEDALQRAIIFPPSQTRGMRERGQALLAEEDWFTETIKIELIRPKTRLDTTDTPFEKVTIKGHTDLEAKVSTLTQAFNIRQKSINTTPLLKEGQVEIIHLGATSKSAYSPQKEAAIELSELKNEHKLAKNPLSIEIQHPLESNEYLIPFTFDGAITIPIGTRYQKASDKTIITIPQFPSYTDLSRQTLTRSPQRAVWFSLLKFIVPKEHVFQLGYIWKYENKQPIYGNLSTQELRDKVKSAKKILLLIHGIIGNTDSMARAVQPLFENEQYLLILTFNYENLNTPIEEITAILDQKLIEIGLDKQYKKKIDVVAHSMGGLVIRQLIERNRNEQPLVDKLLLFGTPNGGSTFANLVKVRDTLLGILTIVSSTSEYLAQPIAPFVYAINGMLGSTKMVSTTLEQLNQESVFIKGLYFNKKAPNTKYHLIAGHFQKTNKGDFWQRLMEKIKNMQLQWIHGENPSDLIVSLQQIQRVPNSFKAKNHVVNCHHTNYFEAKESLKILYKILV